MKKKTLIIFFLLSLAVLGKTQNSKGFGLFTDRETYASGDVLLAKFYSPINNPSRIAYLDLVNQTGTRITGAVIELKNHQAEGYLQLPDSLSSGNYWLRAYSKNTADKFKVIREIWISNRFDGLDKTWQINRTVVSEIIQEEQTNQIEINNLDAEYQTKSTIEANIQIDESLQKEIDGPLLISVAQTTPDFTSTAFAWKSDHEQENMTEKKGIILSGTVTDKKTQKPASGIVVYLTIPDSVPGFQYYHTQQDGRFYFMLDKYYGQVQAIVQCFGETPAQRLKIKLDELFAEPASPAKLRQEPINEEFKNNIKQNIDAVTFQKVFDQSKFNLLPPVHKNQESYPYYGKASRMADPQLFIDLPDFAEISRELLPGVKFRNYNNEPSLQVVNNPTRSYFDEPPLLLIDGIPIRDLNIIKDMGTSDIDRIDVCQSERFYGDLRFPGVVAIYTTKADYSRIPESDQLIRLKLETIQVPVSLAEPKITEPTIPDLRQAIYWNTEAKPAANIPVKCRTSAVTGHFKLTIRGRLTNGTMIFAEKQFEVK